MNTKQNRAKQKQSGQGKVRWAGKGVGGVGGVTDCTQKATLEAYGVCMCVLVSSPQKIIEIKCKSADKKDKHIYVRMYVPRLGW